MMYVVKEAVYIQVNRIVQMLYLHEPTALCDSVFRGAVWAKTIGTLVKLCFAYRFHCFHPKILNDLLSFY